MTQRKKMIIGGGLLVATIIITGMVCLQLGCQNSQILSPYLGQITKNNPTPLEKYSFENLRKRELAGSEIKFEKEIEDGKRANSWLFSYLSDGKKVTGMAKVPLTPSSKKMPVIIMIRGYADEEIYFTGLGTRKAAAVFAENGFITLAPDFLGFGGSDSAPVDVLETRFTRPINVLDLIASVKTLSTADYEKIFLWGHSNGGQIALSVLEITQKNIPTVLWTPVTVGFPESILHYMDSYEKLDEIGKKVFDQIKQFEKDYDFGRFSIDRYFSDINSPIQIHQGGEDSLVPEEWSDEFVNKMTGLGKEVYYFKYPKSDHNLKQDWDEAVEKDLEFFRKYL